MMVACMANDQELGQLWDAARALLDTICSDSGGGVWDLDTTATWELPPKPDMVTFLDGNVQKCTAPSGRLMYEMAAANEKKLWAVDTVLFVAKQLKRHLPERTGQLERAFAPTKRRYTAAMRLYRLAAEFESQAALCAVWEVAEMLRSASSGMQSTAALDDVLTRMHAIGYAGYDFGMNNATQCSSAFWYARAVGELAQALAGIASQLHSVDKLSNTARSGSVESQLTTAVREQFVVVVREVLTSPLYTQPSGDVLEEYRRLLAGTRLVPVSAAQDWVFRQSCASQLSRAEAQRVASAAHALLAASWAQAPAAMDSCLSVSVVRSWDRQSALATHEDRLSWRKAAHHFAQLADGVISEAVRLATAASNAIGAGRIVAGQLWAEAATMQAKIGQKIFLSIKESLPNAPVRKIFTELAYLPDVQQSVRKHVELAQMLEREVMSQEAALDDNILKVRQLSVAHWKAVFSCALNEYTEEEEPYYRHHGELALLLDAVLHAVHLENAPLPELLEVRLYAAEGAHVSAHQPLIDAAASWLPCSLMECGGLLAKIVQRTDLPAAVRQEAQQRAYEGMKALRFIVFALPHNNSSSSDLPWTVDRVDLVRRVATAAVREGEAVLDGAVEVARLFGAARWHYETAQAVYRAKRRLCKRMDLHLIVADQLLNTALAKEQPPSCMPLSKYSDQAVVRHYGKDTDRIAMLQMQRAENAVRKEAASEAQDNKVLNTQLCDLYGSVENMLKLAVNTEIEIIEFRLASGKGKDSAPRLKALTRRRGVLTNCGRWLLGAAQALCDPQAHPALARCLKSAAVYEEKCVLTTDSRARHRIRASLLSVWFRNVSKAITKSLGDAVTDAWLRVTDKGEELFIAEDSRRFGTAQLDAAADVALSMADLAMSITKGRQEEAARKQAELEQLLIIEQCVIGGSANVDAEEAARLTTMAVEARSRIHELKQAAEEEVRGEADGGGDEADTASESSQVALAGMAAADDGEEATETGSIAVDDGSM
jgi:hypothetical protein